MLRECEYEYISAGQSDMMLEIRFNSEPEREYVKKHFIANHQKLWDYVIEHINDHTAITLNLPRKISIINPTSIIKIPSQTFFGMNSESCLCAILYNFKHVDRQINNENMWWSEYYSSSFEVFNSKSEMKYLLNGNDDDNIDVNMEDCYYRNITFHLVHVSGRCDYLLQKYKCLII